MRNTSARSPACHSTMRGMSSMSAAWSMLRMPQSIQARYATVAASSVAVSARAKASGLRSARSLDNGSETRLSCIPEVREEAVVLGEVHVVFMVLFPSGNRVVQHPNSSPARPAQSGFFGQYDCMQADAGAAGHGSGGGFPGGLNSYGPLNSNCPMRDERPAY